VGVSLNLRSIRTLDSVEETSSLFTSVSLFPIFVGYSKTCFLSFAEMSSCQFFRKVSFARTVKFQFALCAAAPIHKVIAHCDVMDGLSCVAFFETNFLTFE